MQKFIYCKATLHVSGVTAPIIRSTKTVTAAFGTDHNTGTATSLPDRDWFVRVVRDSHKPVPIRPRWGEIAVPVV